MADQEMEETTNDWLESLPGPAADLCRSALKLARQAELQKSADYSGEHHGVKMHTTPSVFANETIQAIGDRAILLSTLIHGSLLAPHELERDDGGLVRLKALSHPQNFESVQEGLAATREKIRTHWGSNNEDIAGLLDHLHRMELESQSPPMLWLSVSAHDVLRHLWIEKLNEHLPPESEETIQDVAGPSRAWIIWLYGFRQVHGAFKAHGGGPSYWSTPHGAEVGTMSAEGRLTVHANATVSSFTCFGFFCQRQHLRNSCDTGAWGACMCT